MPRPNASTPTTNACRTRAIRTAERAFRDAQTEQTLAYYRASKTPDATTAKKIIDDADAVVRVARDRCRTLRSAS